VEVLLALRGWEHAERAPEGRAQPVERVSLPKSSTLLLVLILVRSTARMFFGRGAVMAKALGTTPEEEHRTGLHHLAKVRVTPYVCLNHISRSTPIADRRPSRPFLHRL
jgi:hypothetical protein